MPAKKVGSNKEPRRVKQQTEEPLSQDTCFTIMPFGNWFDYYYETIYVPAIKATELIPTRADDLFRPSAIINDIWTLTQEAKIILADLSGKNPNVFYEIGLAHALTKPAILITDSMEDVPYDLRSLRVIVYDKNEPDWGNVLGQKIETAIKEILASPTDAVLLPFLKVRASTTVKTVSKEEKELIYLKQELDLIKRQIQTIPSPVTQYANFNRSLSYNQTRAIVESYLIENVSEEEIVRSLLQHGVHSRLEAKMIISAAKKTLKEERTAAEPPTESQNGTA